MMNDSSEERGGSGRAYKIYAISMVRNDADIISSFLAQAEELFDDLFLVDVQSTDGTREIISSRAASSKKIRLYSIDRQEKYQSAMMNRLARLALAEGADWIFLLDADEFVNIESRNALQNFLRSFPDEIMHLPWINLVPTDYGSFTFFDISQQFRWRGRTSSYNKIAFSSLFAAHCPEFHIHEGNHHVSRNFTSALEKTTHPGLTLLHLPVRSLDRFKYKMISARATLLAKHNRLAGEGAHVLAIINLLETSTLSAEAKLNAIATDYGKHSEELRGADPVRTWWPNIKMPPFTISREAECGKERSLTETLIRDKTIRWDQSEFVKGSVVCAALEGNDVRIKPQPIMGNGNLFNGSYSKLPDNGLSGSPSIEANLIIDAINASFVPIKILVASAWTELVPVLFALFSVHRPRRFVELGTHNGMCFFAACQASDMLGLNTQCVAVDNWIGDPHASFHTSDVFNEFSENLGNNFPNQCYIKAHFRDALGCFENGSIDLLHIDGFHTYEAVKNDFETWLPKMSQSGVIILHDINAHERDFGVWRLWDELEVKYPSFSLLHCHGLGIIYVGTQQCVMAEILSMLAASPASKQILRAFFEHIGELSLEYRKIVSKFTDGESGLHKSIGWRNVQNQTSPNKTPRQYGVLKWSLRHPRKAFCSARRWLRATIGLPDRTERRNPK